MTLTNKCMNDSCPRGAISGSVFCLKHQPPKKAWECTVEDCPARDEAGGFQGTMTEVQLHMMFEHMRYHDVEEKKQA